VIKIAHEKKGETSGKKVVFHAEEKEE